MHVVNYDLVKNEGKLVFERTISNMDLDTPMMIRGDSITPFDLATARTAIINWKSDTGAMLQFHSKATVRKKINFLAFALS